jgi:hypothetical protein
MVLKCVGVSWFPSVIGTNAVCTLRYCYWTLGPRLYRPSENSPGEETSGIVADILEVGMAVFSIVQDLPRWVTEDLRSWFVGTVLLRALVQLQDRGAPREKGWWWVYCSSVNDLQKPGNLPMIHHGSVDVRSLLQKQPNQHGSH